MKYTIMHVNDRAKNNMDFNKKILKDFEYCDGIKFIDGNKENGWDILNHMGIKTNTWNPYDGRKTEPLPGEYGIWVSTINLWQYIVDNKIDKLLVLEDDVVLQENFVENFNLYLNELPNDFDFLSFYYFSGQNEVDDNTEIGLKYIHKSNNQYSAAQCMLYSYSCAQKLLKLIKRKGTEYTNDCFIYNQAHVGSVNGYSIKKGNNIFLKHDYKKIKSIIDPDNTRNTDDL
jgi:GR25 family glycosyltransferase involved in LPS biosynthesis